MLLSVSLCRNISVTFTATHALRKHFLEAKAPQFTFSLVLLKCCPQCQCCAERKGPVFGPFTNYQRWDVLGAQWGGEDSRPGTFLEHHFSFHPHVAHPCCGVWDTEHTCVILLPHPSHTRPCVQCRWEVISLVAHWENIYTYWKPEWQVLWTLCACHLGSVINILSYILSLSLPVEMHP